MEDKIKVEIWSDVMCPFCYIGKRKFEAALAAFPHKDEIEVVWHSFQLNPSLENQPGKDVYTYLAEVKGQTLEWSVRVHQSVIEMAENVGLEYHFEKAKIANSFDAHRVIQLAKKYNMTDEIEERFFKAYFTEGELISDRETLIRLATEAGLSKAEVTAVLESDQYSEDVKFDGAEAKKLGANGVPFFLMNKKFSVYGAQDSSVFTTAIQKAYDAWKNKGDSKPTFRMV